MKQDTAIGIAVGVGLVLGANLIRSISKLLKPYKTRVPPPTPQKGNPEDKIILYGCNIASFPNVAADVSPFVTKVEAFLRLAGIPYEKVIFKDGENPKQKIPYIKHGSNLVADSDMIIQYLYQTYGDKIAAPLRPTSPKDKATTTLVKRLVEEHTYFGALYFRWIWNDAKQLKDYYDKGYFVCLDALPKLLHPLILKQLTQVFAQYGWAQGVARHSEEEIVAKLRDDFQALQEIIGDKQFVLGGDKPSVVDCTVFAAIENYAHFYYPSPLKDLLWKEFPDLIAYADRMRERAWAD